ncbi:ATP-binding protein [Enhygromyxa salina]|uniref:Type II secretory pathway, ATPase PulE/Tfp pilus assembly pathway, ATPase PilB n=1 Tax=Enhygromyxa salina TaxID=215803 RepID=A0A2S9XWT7_9BACT|nr:ATP-binding protein [Enhygromyxa salina]PRP97312.1 hypothetical protein ENSA7_66620 [Enhygromyxa salina]
MIDPATTTQLRQLYQNLVDQPLWPDDPRYVDLYADPGWAALDPVARLATRIRFSAIESSQLFSGHRGTGKSTQLRKLQRELEGDPTYKVVICDMEDYLPMTDAVDEVDFMLGAAGALSDALVDAGLLGRDSKGDYWTRFVDWLRGQRIDVEQLGLDAKVPVGPGAELRFNVKANLKSDAAFRERVRERMKLHVGAFRAEVHGFAQDCVKWLRAEHGDDTQLVVIYDSIEHLRGITTNERAVAESVEGLFRGHGDALRFPHVHTIYTVPPWLRLHYAGTDGFDSYCQIPCIKVRKRAPDPGGQVQPDPAGLDVLWRVAGKRGDMQWLLRDRAAFDELALACGGYLRDLFRMLTDLTAHAALHGVPVAGDRCRLAIEELRSAYQGFTNRQAVWLQAIEDSGRLDIPDLDDQHTIARFLDTHVLLAYRNGEDWYAVHPVIRELVADRAAAWHRAQRGQAER